MPRKPAYTEPAIDPWSVAEPPQRPVPAWGMSLLLHAVLMLAMGWLVRTPSPGVLPEPERTAGIVLTRQTRDEVTYFSDAEPAPDLAATFPDGEGEAAERYRDAEWSDSDGFPGAVELPGDVATALPAGESLRAHGTGEWSDALPRADALTAGQGPSRALGEGTRTSVFGAEGYGSRFVYVFDRSGSMSWFGGTPLAAAKAALSSSLRSLQPTDQFQILFYNHEFTVFNPSQSATPSMLFATEDNLAQAERFVFGISAVGGTEHVAPLQAALRLAPDVLFFLTDADEPQLSGAELDRLRRMNRGTAIHAIEFGVGPSGGGENFLQRLARQNDGQHVYVDVMQLGNRSETRGPR